MQRKKTTKKRWSPSAFCGQQVSIPIRTMKNMHKRSIKPCNKLDTSSTTSAKCQGGLENPAAKQMTHQESPSTMIQSADSQRCPNSPQLRLIHQIDTAWARETKNTSRYESWEIPLILKGPKLPFANDATIKVKLDKTQRRRTPRRMRLILKMSREKHRMPTSQHGIYRNASKSQKYGCPRSHTKLNRALKLLHLGAYSSKLLLGVVSLSRKVE